MAPKAGGKAGKYKQDVPWRAAGKSVPRVSSAGVAAISDAPRYQYALSVMKHPDPIGMGLAREAVFEPAGAECIVPGLVRPVKVLGVQVWPLGIQNPISLKALEPIGRELKTIGAVVDKAFDLMSASFGDR